jgi:hypothetical protein
VTISDQPSPGRAIGCPRLNRGATREVVAHPDDQMARHPVPAVGPEHAQAPAPTFALATMVNRHGRRPTAGGRTATAPVVPARLLRVAVAAAGLTRHVG